MEKELLSSLINKSVVRIGTEVTIVRRGSDLGGTPNAKVEERLEVLTHKKVKGEFVLEAFSTETGKVFKVKAKHIRKIDGMVPDRLVSAHKAEGKKRGRKPKKR